MILAADGGTSWSAMSGIPLVPVMDLVYSAPNSMVIAATYGRGMYRLRVGTQSAVLRGDVDGDNAVTDFDAYLILLALIGEASSHPMPRGDANCNGSTDETLTTLGDLCTVGAGICMRQGTVVCRADATGTNKQLAQG